MIPRMCEDELTWAADDVISLVCRKQMGAMRRPPSSEVDFVASLIENGVDMLDRKWKAILRSHGVDVSVAGVFCHQSPKVAIREKPPRAMPTLVCELADLLVLHSHETGDGRIFWRGTLIQTKIYSSRPFMPDEPQFWLYDEWPSFSITAPGYDPRKRNFGADRRGGHYGLVSNAEWMIVSPTYPMSVNAPLSLEFGSFLVAMLYDMDPAEPLRSSKHGRQVYHNSSKDWSKTVWEIVTTTGDMALKHIGKTKGLYDAPLPTRRGGQVLPFLGPQQRFVSIPPSKAEGAQPSPQGMSIFHVSTTVGAE